MTMELDASARQLKWDARFLEVADVIARWSKDPSRGVGSVIVSSSMQIIATGFNGLPRGVEDLPERLERPVKYDLIVHAELNAVVQCARNGVSPVDGTLYSTFFPCVHCALAIVQSGIRRVVTYGLTDADAHWLDSIGKSEAVLREAGIAFAIVNRSV
ncbi:MAG: dCMP deaminase family protein [Phycisphaerales bacterium]|nr:dCMP deaminase family protein [Phycisphaerales bacterium]